MKKLICLLTVFVSLFFMQVPVKASDINWDISKSKTATQLDENYRSQVTLLKWTEKVGQLRRFTFYYG